MDKIRPRRRQLYPLVDGRCCRFFDRGGPAALETYEKLLQSNQSDEIRVRRARAEAQINLAQIYYDNDQLPRVRTFRERNVRFTPLLN